MGARKRKEDNCWNRWDCTGKSWEKRRWWRQKSKSRSPLEMLKREGREKWYNRNSWYNRESHWGWHWGRQSLGYDRKLRTLVTWTVCKWTKTMCGRGWRIKGTSVRRERMGTGNADTAGLFDSVREPALHSQFWRQDQADWWSSSRGRIKEWGERTHANTGINEDFSSRWTEARMS